MVGQIRVSATSNIDRWLRNFEREVNTAREKVSDEPKKQAMFGQRLGVALAPRDKHAVLIRAISYKVAGKDKSRGQAMVWVKPLVHPTDNKSTVTRGRADKYVSIHHNLPVGKGVRGQAKSGDPHWMYTVHDEIWRRYKARIVMHIQSISK